MKNLKKNEIANFGYHLAHECAEILLKYSKKMYRKPLSITNKGAEGLTSEADYAAEKWAIKKIKKHFPEHLILAEEQAFLNNQHLASDESGLWLIDPLDGTTNFLQGLPFYCVSLAYMKKGITQFGIILAPELNQTFFALSEQGAYMERRWAGKKVQKKLTLKKIGSDHIKDALISTNLGSARHNASLIRQFPQVKAFRRLGSAALELAYVGAGILDVYWEYNLKPWDTAAGSLIAKEAGAIVTDLNGLPYSPFSPKVLCSKKELHQNLLKIVR
jgi:myo-inositol-1(or 4)-monophosphatase